MTAVPAAHAEVRPRTAAAPHVLVRAGRWFFEGLAIYGLAQFGYYSREQFPDTDPGLEQEHRS